ncbi:MAG: GNAT family N-acetyltransferase [Thermoplasmatota archaeon]
MVVRAAVASDAPAIARVHVATWQTAYRGLVPVAYLDGLSADERVAMWRDILSSAETGVFVALDEGEIVGFVSCGRERTDDARFRGEVTALYVSRAYERRGHGRALFAAATAWLRGRGWIPIRVWVLRDGPAVAFYERMGGLRVGERSDEIGGARLREVSFAWSDASSIG